MRAVLLVPAAALLLAQSPPESAGAALRDLMRRAEAAFQQRDYRQAESLYQSGLSRALESGSRNGEAYALHGLGRIDNARGDFPSARARLTKAFEIFRTNPAWKPEQARTRNDLAYTEWATGDHPAAARLYRDALAAFRELGYTSEAARTTYNLAFMTRPGPARLPLLEESLAAANGDNNSRLAGKTLHLWGDTLYTLGDLRGALEKTGEAISRLSAPADRGDLARALISLGRLHATHYRLEPALSYFLRALAIHRELGEKQSIVHALNSISDAHRSLGDFARAEAHSAEAVRVSRETASNSLIAGTLISYSRLLLARGELTSALGMLREAAQLHANGIGREYLYLTDALLRLDRPAEALAEAETAVERASRGNGAGFQAEARYRRARALDAAGRSAEALADIRGSLALIEKLRSQAGPTDFLKRGYAEAWKEPTAFAVELLFRHGLYEEALEAAEKSRARAFLDLLASRSLADRIEGPPQPAAGEPHLASAAAAPPPTAAAIRDVARATRSTLLAYWMGRDAVYVWVVPPSGPVGAGRIAATPQHLEELIRRAALPVLSTEPLTPEIRTRGGTPAGKAGGTGSRSELYRLLVAPVARFLPAAPSALTIVPHGALYRLSFAALQNSRGRYLLEDYRIAYLPSAVMAEQPAGSPGRSVLFVADPLGLPPGPGGKALPALPGARRETMMGARALRGSSIRLLTGAEADEAAVRRSLGDARVLHFATHGLLMDRRPFDSFLALGRRSPSPPEDGQLTVREIYSLKLRADLVVLSACRTADGLLTGDGVNGMTRAFLFAGARGVLATLWDVADEPTQRLVSRFYLHYGRGQAVADALRLAQLDLLAALRKRQVRVETPLGSVVLRENPSFWAGFALFGRP